MSLLAFLLVGHDSEEDEERDRHEDRLQQWRHDNIIGFVTGVYHISQMFKEMEQCTNLPETCAQPGNGLEVASWDITDEGPDVFLDQHSISADDENRSSSDEATYARVAAASILQSLSNFLLLIELGALSFSPTKHSSMNL